MGKPPRDKTPPPERELGLAEFSTEPDDAGISLESLSEAYAQLIGRGEDPYRPAADPDSPTPSPPASAAEETSGEEPVATGDDRCDVSPRTILEAMLFVGHPGNVPLTAQLVASKMRGVRPHEIDQLVRELNETYAAEGCPYEIVSQGVGYLLTLREEFAGLRDKFYGRVRQARLSQAAVDVLAVIAYHQPLTREEVERLRGKPSGAILTQLVRRQLLRIDRSEEKDQPRQRRYWTTERFLALFGLSNLDELPRSQEMDKSL